MTEIEQLRRDIMVLVLRLMGEPEWSFAPETAEVMKRYRPIVEGACGMLPTPNELAQDFFAAHLEKVMVVINGQVFSR